MSWNFKHTVAGLALAACASGAWADGHWSNGKLIDTAEGQFTRYTMDIGGGVRLYVILPEASDAMSPRAVHLVPRAQLRPGARHWLYYTQETCRWDLGASAWTDLVVGDRMPMAIPTTEWADDAMAADAPASAPTALDAQLLEIESAPELLAVFDESHSTWSTIFPAPQMLDADRGICLPPVAGGDNGVVGSIVLAAQLDEGHRIVDLAAAAEMLHRSIARDALVGMRAAAAIIGVDGRPLGDATFEQTPSGVLIGVSVMGIEPGAHGIHLHRVGSCTPEFTSASGHINPDGRMHGLRHPEGPDNGDLPLLHVAADGSATTEFYTTRVSLSADAAGPVPGLLDADGSAIVIHADPDDHLTQPIGGAGARVGCGVVVSSRTDAG